MGAHFLIETFDGNLSHKMLEAKVDKLITSERYEYGTDAYSGTWGNIPSLRITSQTFSGISAAEQWLAENCVKWESAKAVRAEERGISPRYAKKVEAAKAAYEAFIWGDRPEETWITHHDRELRDARSAIRRAHGVKAEGKHQTCPDCGSKIASGFATQHECPVCLSGCFLLSKEGVKAMKKALALHAKAAAKAKALSEMVKTLEEQAKADPKAPVTTYWVVGALSPS